EVEGRGAVHAAPPAVAHGRAFDGALVARAAELIGAWPPGATWEVGNAGEHDAVTLSTNGHFTSLEKATPRDRRNSHRGASGRLTVSATEETRRCRSRRVLRLRSRRCRTSVFVSRGGRDRAVAGWMGWWVRSGEGGLRHGLEDGGSLPSP